MYNDDWVGKEIGNVVDDKKINSFILKFLVKFLCSKFVFVVEWFKENLLIFIEI